MEDARHLARLVKKSKTGTDDFLPSTLRIASLAWEVKAADIRAYDVRNLTLIADSFVICTATSEPQLKAVYNAVKEGMKEVGVAPLRAEGKPDGSWMVLDYGNVVFHIFREEARAFYDLDGFWADAPALELNLESD